MSQDDASSSGARSAVRERAVAEMFVSLADTLVDDYDVVEVLDRLVRSCVSLLDVSEAGLLLDDQRGQLALVASSSEETRLLEMFQLQSNQGPCLDCVRGRAIVTSDDLEADRGRWPTFVPEALKAGFRSVTAVPLRLRDGDLPGAVVAAGPSLRVLRAFPSYVERVHEQGHEVHVWTVDGDDDVDYVLDLGVDVVITNRPAAVRQIVDERATSSAV